MRPSTANSLCYDYIHSRAGETVRLVGIVTVGLLLRLAAPAQRKFLLLVDEDLEGAVLFGSQDDSGHGKELETGIKFGMCSAPHKPFCFKLS